MNAYQGASVAALFKGFNDAGVPDNTAIDLVRPDGCQVGIPDCERGHGLFLGQLDTNKGPMVLETPPLRSA